jgi:hypothetical protein
VALVHHVIDQVTTVINPAQLTRDAPPGCATRPARSRQGPTSAPDPFSLYLVLLCARSTTSHDSRKGPGLDLFHSTVASAASVAYPAASYLGQCLLLRPNCNHSAQLLLLCAVPPAPAQLQLQPSNLVSDPIYSDLGVHHGYSTCHHRGCLPCVRHEHCRSHLHCHRCAPPPSDWPSPLCCCREFPHESCLECHWHLSRVTSQMLSMSFAP